MTTAIFNPRSSGDKVKVIVSRFNNARDHMTGGIEVHNMRDLCDVNLSESETWVFVYPRQFGIQNGAELRPNSYQVSEALEGSVVEAKSMDVSGKKVEEIRSEVRYRLNNSFVSSA